MSDEYEFKRKMRENLETSLGSKALNKVWPCPVQEMDEENPGNK